MRCKFFGELHGPFGSGSKTFSQRTARRNGEFTAAAAAAAAPPPDAPSAYDRTNTRTSALFFPAGLLLARRRLSPGSSLPGRLLFVRSGADCLEETLPHDCEAPAPLNLPGSG